jgi:DNA modification methylase
LLELNKIYNMDCLEGLKLLDDNSVDSIVTDPPYELTSKHGARSPQLSYWKLNAMYTKDNSIGSMSYWGGERNGN